MNEKVKRILSFAKNTEIFNGSIVTGLWNVDPNSRAMVSYLVTFFVDPQVFTTTSS